MSLPLLVIIVVAGVAGVVLAVHLAGGSARATLDKDAALQRFAEDFPDLAVASVRLTRSRDTAFLALADGRVGIVRAVGGKFLTRVVVADDLAGRPRADDATLAIRFRDFTWPGGVFAFAGREDARAVETMLAGLRGTGTTEKG